MAVPPRLPGEVWQQMRSNPGAGKCLSVLFRRELAVRARLSAHRDGCAAIAVPKNAFLNDQSYGSGWDCARGYRKTADACEAIILPENSYLDPTSSATGWSCARGYRATATACELVKIPNQAYFAETSHGQSWKCERGYRSTENQCEKIVLPENGHLDYSGNDWDCDPPFARRGQACMLLR